MIIRLVLGLTLLTSTTAWTQTVQNPGFETPLDTNWTLPASWRVNTTAGYTIALDSRVAHSGRRSLRIASVPDAAVSQAGFSQTATVQLDAPTVVHLRGFVKTDNPAGIGIWWNAWRDQQHEGFRHSYQQVNLRQTDDWQPFELVLATSKAINQFTFGAYLTGRGSVWFDNLRFETGPVGTGAPSAKVRAYLNKAVALLKKHALVHDSIAWPQTEADLMAFARGMQTQTQTYPLMYYLLDQLRKAGDNHSLFLNPAQAKNLKADHPANEGPLVSERPDPKARYLGNGMGYVAVPGFRGINRVRETAFATQIQSLIRRVDSAQTVTTWVVDLRGNTGGNVFPMVAGLRPLYGKNAKRQYRRVTNVPHPYWLRTPAHRIAVLIDDRTTSSGEFTALSFIGLPNVRSFGMHSAGYTTGNGGYELPDGAMLFIAQSVGQDRAGKQYPHGIAPDEEVKSVSTPTDDPTLEAAKVWLLTK